MIDAFKKKMDDGEFKTGNTKYKLFRLIMVQFHQRKCRNSLCYYSTHTL
jgi:hypothetical protein